MTHITPASPAPGTRNPRLSLQLGSWLWAAGFGSHTGMWKTRISQASGYGSRAPTLAVECTRGKLPEARGAAAPTQRASGRLVPLVQPLPPARSEPSCLSWEPHPFLSSVPRGVRHPLRSPQGLLRSLPMGLSSQPRSPQQAGALGLRSAPPRDAVHPEVSMDVPPGAVRWEGALSCLISLPRGGAVGPLPQALRGLHPGVSALSRGF